jgi:TorA maturation chaperone TorD
MFLVAKRQHTFVDDYDGMVGFGFSREVDEDSLKFYLQAFSDDELLKVLVPRLSDDELTQLFELMSRLMRKYLAEHEYHRYFLKDGYD